MLGYLSLFLIGCGVYFLFQTLRHIKYMLTFYGLKFPLMFLGAAIIETLISNIGFIEGITQYVTITFGLWVIAVAIKLGWALWKSPSFQEGFNNTNYNNLDKEKWAPSEKTKPKIFGSEPAPNRKKKSTKNDSQNTKSAPEKRKSSEQAARPKKEASPKYSTPYSSSMKTCSTCAMWGGDRKLDASRVVVRTTASNVNGECMGGGHNHHQTPASGSCASHTKWASLK
jgi:hypothetical protein